MASEAKHGRRGVDEPGADAASEARASPTGVRRRRLSMPLPSTERGRDEGPGVVVTGSVRVRGHFPESASSTEVAGDVQGVPVTKKMSRPSFLLGNLFRRKGEDKGHDGSGTGGATGERNGDANEEEEKRAKRERKEREKEEKKAKKKKHEKERKSKRLKIGKNRKDAESTSPEGGGSLKGRTVPPKLDLSFDSESPIILDAMTPGSMRMEEEREAAEAEEKRRRAEAKKQSGSFVALDETGHESSCSSSSSSLASGYTTPSYPSSSPSSPSSLSLETPAAENGGEKDEGEAEVVAKDPPQELQEPQHVLSKSVSGPLLFTRSPSRTTESTSPVVPDDADGSSTPLRLFDEHTRAYRSGSVTRPPASVAQSVRVTAGECCSPPTPLGASALAARRPALASQQERTLSPPTAKSPLAAETPVETGRRCTCDCLERHLWLPKCKKCFHPVSFHINGGACTYIEKEGEEEAVHTADDDAHKTHADATSSTEQGGQGGALYTQQLLRSKSFVAIPGSARNRPASLPPTRLGTRKTDRRPRHTLASVASSQLSVSHRASSTGCVSDGDGGGNNESSSSDSESSSSEEAVSEDEIGKEESLNPTAEETTTEGTATVATTTSGQEVPLESAQVDATEVEELRVVSDRLAHFLGDDDDTPHDPMPLARVFEVLVTSAIRASGMEDMPFVKDFLAGYTLALSTKPGFGRLEPLDDAQWQALQTVGRTLWDFAGQQEFLRTLTYSQAFIAARAAQRRSQAWSVWRTGAALGWLHSVMRVRNDERRLLQFMDNFEELEALRAVCAAHQDLHARLDRVCQEYPAESAFTVGATLKLWLAGAKAPYRRLYAAMVGLESDSSSSGSGGGGRGAEQAEVLAHVWAHLAQYGPAVEDIAAHYGVLCAADSVPEAAKARMRADSLLLGESAALARTLCASIAEDHRAEQEERRQRERAPAHEGAHAARHAGPGHRKSVRDLYPQLPAPSFLPASSTRRAQFQGCLRAAVMSDDDNNNNDDDRDTACAGTGAHGAREARDKRGARGARHHQYRFFLFSDALVLYSRGAAPRAVASMMLASTVVYPRGDAGFVLCNPSVRLEVTRWKPDRLLAAVRADVAQLRVFGVDLDDLMACERDSDCGVPRAALRCMELVEQKGFASEGLFRVNGNPAVMQVLRAAFDSRLPDVDISGVRGIDAAQLFKRFLAELPEPLLTTACVHRLRKLDLRAMDEDDVVAACQNIFRKMPETHLALAHVVFDFLSVCADQEFRTKMGVNNLATIFAPILIRETHIPARPFNVVDDSTLMDVASLTEMKDLIKLTAIMINNHLDIFP